MWKFSVLSMQFFCKSRTALKIVYSLILKMHKATRTKKIGDSSKLENVTFWKLRKSVEEW